MTTDGTTLLFYYDADGNTTSVTDANGNDVSSGVTAKEVPFRYRGYVYDDKEMFSLRRAAALKTTSIFLIF